jgi:hypothetical protein
MGELRPQRKLIRIRWKLRWFGTKSALLTSIGAGSTSLDAVQSGLFTRDVGARLLQKNTLDEGPPPP